MQWNVQSSLEAVTNYCANPYTAKPAKRWVEYTLAWTDMELFSSFILRTANIL